MANDKISNMTAAAVAALTGTGAAVEVSTGLGGVPATKQGLLRDLRTAMFAGGTGYTASDPLVCGTLDASGTSTLTGTIGAGGAPGAATGFNVLYTTLSTAYQTGISSQITASSAATSAVTGFYGTISTAAASYTCAAGRLIWLVSPTLGAGSAVTDMYGIQIQNMGASGIANAYGIYINAQSGAATTNIGLYNAGTTQLAGTVGIGASPNATSALYVSAPTRTGTGQFGINVESTFSSAATSYGVGVGATLITAASSYTMTAGYAFYAGPVSLGAGSAITTMHGSYISNQGASGVTTAYGIYVAAQSGATTNYAIKCNGGQVNLGLPTSSAGLASGSLWSNGGVVTVA